MDNGIVFLKEDKNREYRVIRPNYLNGCFEPVGETIPVMDVTSFGFEINVDQYGEEKRKVLTDTVNFLVEQARKRGVEYVLTDLRYADGGSRYGIHGRARFYCVVDR